MNSQFTDEKSQSESTKLNNCILRPTRRSIISLHNFSVFILVPDLSNYFTMTYVPTFAPPIYKAVRSIRPLLMARFATWREGASNVRCISVLDVPLMLR